MNKTNIIKLPKNGSKDENKTRHCRARLQDRFDKSDSSEKSNRSILTIVTLEDTRRIIHSGAEKICKTFNDLRTNLGTFTQVPQYDETKADITGRTGDARFYYATYIFQGTPGKDAYEVIQPVQYRQPLQ